MQSSQSILTGLRCPLNYYFWFEVFNGILEIFEGNSFLKKALPLMFSFGSKHSVISFSIQFPPTKTIKHSLRLFSCSYCLILVAASSPSMIDISISVIMFALLVIVYSLLSISCPMHHLNITSLQEDPIDLSIEGQVFYDHSFQFSSISGVKSIWICEFHYIKWPARIIYLTGDNQDHCCSFIHLRATTLKFRVKTRQKKI